MNLILTRRRFGQLAIASGAAAGLAYFADKTLAEQPTTTLVGVLADVESGRLILKSVDLGNLAAIADVSDSFDKKENELETNVEQLADLTSDDDELYLSSNSPSVKTDKKANKEIKRNQLRQIGRGNSKKLTLTGLANGERIKGLEILSDKSLLAIVGQNNVFGANRIVRISREKGDIVSSEFNLPSDRNFFTLTQDPGGTIYTSSTRPTGYTSIERIDLGARQAIELAQLNFNGSVWNNGLAGLACSSAGELFALTAPRYVTRNNLYKVNLSNGGLSLLIPGFNANKITFLSGKDKK